MSRTPVYCKSETCGNSHQTFKTRNTKNYLKISTKQSHQTDITNNITIKNITYNVIIIYTCRDPAANHLCLFILIFI